MSAEYAGMMFDNQAPERHAPYTAALQDVINYHSKNVPPLRVRLRQSWADTYDAVPLHQVLARAARAMELANKRGDFQFDEWEAESIKGDADMLKREMDGYGRGGRIAGSDFDYAFERCEYVVKLIRDALC